VSARSSTSIRVGGIAQVIGRSLLVGLGYTVGTMVSGMLAGALGLEQPTLPSTMEPTMVLVMSFISGLIFGLTLGGLSRQLPLPMLHHSAVMAFLLFVVHRFVNLVEGAFFTTTGTSGLGFTLLSVAVSSLLAGSLIAVLFPPGRVEEGLLAALRRYFAQRKWAAWVWRLSLAVLLYLPIYFIMGMIVAPVVTPYYTDPALGLGLVAPGLEVILPLEILRGAIFVVGVLPVIAVWQGSRASLALWLGLTIVVLGAAAPMVEAYFLPLTLRLVHGAEISISSLLQGLVCAWLLWVEFKKVG
jgi:hypothetical protein